MNDENGIADHAKRMIAESKARGELKFASFERIAGTSLSFGSIALSVPRHDTSVVRIAFADSEANVTKYLLVDDAAELHDWLGRALGRMK